MEREIELQFKVASLLSQVGIPFELELHTVVGRFDIAICDGEHLWAILECKRRPGNRSRSFQLARYASVGVPLHVVTPETDLGGAFI